MTLQALLHSCIIVQDFAYLPAIVPAEYGGTTILNFSLALTDGASLFHSSFELDSIPEDGGFDQLMSIMRQEVESSGLRPRCDFLDPALTAQYRRLSKKSPVSRLISACLCGEHCRYDGGASAANVLSGFLADGSAVPVCPELSGGLPSPRPPCELAQGKVVDAGGGDHTAAFMAGAQRVLAAARALGADNAVLKERSPSCGVHFIYDGTFTGNRIPGQGLAAQMLSAQGIRVCSEEDL